MIECFLLPMSHTIPFSSSSSSSSAGQCSREAASSTGHLQETQNSKEKEAKGPQRAGEAGVRLRLVLQGHPSQHQGPEPQRHVRGGVQDRGLHVGQPGRGAETGRKENKQDSCVCRCK